MIILRNEILFSDNEEIIYKTIYLKEDLYGMHSSKRGSIVEPSFLHIFEFDEDGNTVVISPNEEFFEMDFNGIVLPLSEEKREWYRNLIIKNSRCNCYASEGVKKECQICDGCEQIENAYADKHLNRILGW